MAFDRIKEHLAAGDTYQVNLTFKIVGQFAGDPRALFADLVSAQRGSHSAFISSAEWSICSASPELFFDVDGMTIRARPMKGTVGRGRTLSEDAGAARRLQTSEKQRAENVMIVDMVRNDLGRVAEVGSVSVPALFTVERYPHVWQMTSLVTAPDGGAARGDFRGPASQRFGDRRPQGPDDGDCAGPRTGRPRRVYGSDWPRRAGRPRQFQRRHPHRGDRPPHRAASSSAPAAASCGIRMRRPSMRNVCSRARCSVGGAPLRVAGDMRWSPVRGFFLLERHLSRLRDSADYFGFPFEESAITSALSGSVRGLPNPGAFVSWCPAPGKCGRRKGPCRQRRRRCGGAGSRSDRSAGCLPVSQDHQPRRLRKRPGRRRSTRRFSGIRAARSPRRPPPTW